MEPLTIMGNQRVCKRLTKINHEAWLHVKLQTNVILKSKTLLKLLTDISLAYILTAKHSLDYSARSWRQRRTIFTSSQQLGHTETKAKKFTIYRRAYFSR